ncbi:MAG: winged helix-turn-helix domain-containing protein [Planctomycetes bacterium]|nr:winged helix-turn-helix domain-containing protein [Planctomycetota bacterium]
MATKTKTSTAKKPAKKAAAKPTPAEAGEPKMSALDAAAKVLKEKGIAMTCPELIGVMAAKGYWSSPGGKTPAATLSSAILREITTKGDASRFAKTAPGRFAAKDAPVVAIATAPLPAKKGKAKKAATNTTEATDTPAEPTATPAA